MASAFSLCCTPPTRLLVAASFTAPSSPLFSVFRRMAALPGHLSAHLSPLSSNALTYVTASHRNGHALGQDPITQLSPPPQLPSCDHLHESKKDFVHHNVGAIHLIVGPMFAGKTTALLHRVQREADAGRRVSLVKSDKDTRYGVQAVVSHDGVQMPCVAVPTLATFREHVGEEEYSQMEVIGIDEAQFFDDLLEFCQIAADLDNKTVIVAGLDGDFLRRRFGAALDLLPLADTVTKLHARCEHCNQPAPFTFRKTSDTHTEVIGGADVYMPVCRHHFVSGQVAVGTARAVLQVQKEFRRSVSSGVENAQARASRALDSVVSL